MVFFCVHPTPVHSHILQVKPRERVLEIVLYEFILRPIEQASYLGSTRSNIVAEGEIRSETDILIPPREDDRLDYCSL